MNEENVGALSVRDTRNNLPNCAQKGNKGITLVALIITIIVLLILAVVTIKAVQGDGILAHAKNARDDYDQAATVENERLQGYDDYITEQIGESASTNHSEVIVSEIEKTGVFADNPYIVEVREGNIPIPTGFTYVKGDKIGGAVITDGISEFVWVPTTTDIVAYGLGTTGYREPDVVLKEMDWAIGEEKDGGDSIPDNLQILNDILGTTYANSDDFLLELQSDFNEMAGNVNKYHGFYVGRYEMSLNGIGNAQSKSGETSATAAGDSANTWYGLYAKAKTYTNSANSVVSSMIYGSQYDAMMSWIGDAANSEIEGKNTSRVTGSVPTDILNNVYDLYGNSFEWTQEATGTGSRIFRGECFASELAIRWSPSHRGGDYPANENSGAGSRLALYIK